MIESTFKTGKIAACKKCYQESLEWQKDGFHYPSSYICIRHTLQPAFIKNVRKPGFTKKQAEFLSTI